MPDCLKTRKRLWSQGNCSRRRYNAKQEVTEKTASYFETTLTILLRPLRKIQALQKPCDKQPAQSNGKT